MNLQKMSAKQIGARGNTLGKIDERGIYTWRITAPYKEGLVTIRTQIIIPS